MLSPSPLSAVRSRVKHMWCFSLAVRLIRTGSAHRPSLLCKLGGVGVHLTRLWLAQRGVTVFHFSPKSVDEKQRAVIRDTTHHNSEDQYGMRLSP